MAVNRFDTPAQAEFINTYVPIPFEQLYTLGNQASAKVDSALNDLSGTLDKWSDFRSPSELDTQAWYNETLGRVEPVIERLSSNPDLIKTAAGRSELFSALNNVNRAKLSSLMQSKDALEQRQKVNQQLALSGKYNPLWHDVDFTNYNTLDNGIFNDVSPLAYTSIQELVDPYVKGIQDSFLRTDGSYDYTGVTADQIAGIIDQNLSGLLITPEAQKHIQVYLQQNPGATVQEAETMFRNKAVQDSMKYVRENRSENRFALEAFKERQYLARQKNSGKEPDTPPNPGLLTDQLALSGQDALTNNILANNNRFPNTISLIANNPNSSPSMKAEAIAKDARDLFEEGTMTPIDKVKSFWRLRAGINNVLDNFSTNLGTEAFDAIISNEAVDKESTNRGTEYRLKDSKDLFLPKNLAIDIMGVAPQGKQFEGKAGKDFERDLTEGKFKNIRVQNGNEIYTYIKDGQLKQAMKMQVSIPVSELQERGYKNAFPQWAFFLRGISPEYYNIQERIKDEGGYFTVDENGNEIAVFEVAKEVPTDGPSRSWINQDYINKQTSKTYGNKVYEDVQGRSFFGFDNF